MNRPNSQKIEVAKPQISPYGLLSPAVKVITMSNDWWVAGAIHEVFDGGLAYSVVADQGYDPDDVIREMVVADLGDSRYVHVVPVTIEARINTSTLGMKIYDLETMAEDAIELVQQKAIEEAFWEYLGTKFRALPDSDAEGTDRTPVGGPVSPRHAQAILEGAVADNTVGYKATLHFPRIAASNLRVKCKDGELHTAIGSSVIAGSGYSNIGVDGSELSDTQRVAYATGPVTVVLGESVILPGDISQSINTATNTAEIFVQKPALIAFSTKDVFSVLVDTTLDF